MKIHIIYVHLSRFNTSYSIIFPLKTAITILYTIMSNIPSKNTISVNGFNYEKSFSSFCFDRRPFVWIYYYHWYLVLKSFNMKILCDFKRYSN